ncbi:hypothetical protein BDF22DRAFT_674769 [Syncephalis plumigaleata]|nr:hypothetical protein BDF22DRAFT_674769 [Syncephalis plumigaleata]
MTFYYVLFFISFLVFLSALVIRVMSFASRLSLRTSLHLGYACQSWSCRRALSYSLLRYSSRSLSTTRIVVNSNSNSNNNNNSSSSHTTNTDWPASIGSTGQGMPDIPAHFLRNCYATIPDRSFIQLSGEDSVKFLQGLVTNHMHNIATGGEGFNTAFLTPQVRSSISGCFYLSAILIDCPATERDAILAHLRKYKLRAKVTIESTEAYTVWSVWGPATTQLWWRHHSIDGAEAVRWPAGQLIKTDNVGFAAIGMQDRRATGMGYRIVMPRQESINLPNEFTELSSDDYTTWRILRGVAEGVHDFVPGQSLPLECNLDYMHGVDFRKGCYVGQELTIRTYHKGVVRKRIMPVQLLPADTPMEQWSSIPFSHPIHQSLPSPGLDMELLSPSSSSSSSSSSRTRRSPARLCSVSSNMNVALALLRLEHVQEGRVFLIPSASDTSTVAWLARPWIPQWWPKITTETSTE